MHSPSKPNNINQSPFEALAECMRCMHAICIFSQGYRDDVHRENRTQPNHCWLIAKADLGAERKSHTLERYFSKHKNIEPHTENSEPLLSWMCHKDTAERLLSVRTANPITMTPSFWKPLEGVTTVRKYCQEQQRIRNTCKTVSKGHKYCYWGIYELLMH